MVMFNSYVSHYQRVVCPKIPWLIIICLKWCENLGPRKSPFRLLGQIPDIHPMSPNVTGNAAWSSSGIILIYGAKRLFWMFFSCTFSILVCTTQKGLYLGNNFWNPHFGKYSPKSPRSTVRKSFGNITSTRVQQAQHFFAVP